MASVTARFSSATNSADHLFEVGVSVRNSTLSIRWEDRWSHSDQSLKLLLGGGARQYGADGAGSVDDSEGAVDVDDQSDRSGLVI